MAAVADVPYRDLSLAQRAFLHALQALAAQRADLIRDARVAVKRNAAGDLVFAVIVPTRGGLPEGRA